MEQLSGQLDFPRRTRVFSCKTQEPFWERGKLPSWDGVKHITQLIFSAICHNFTKKVMSTADSWSTSYTIPRQQTKRVQSTNKSLVSEWPHSSNSNTNSQTSLFLSYFINSWLWLQFRWDTGWRPALGKKRPPTSLCGRVKHANSRLSILAFVINNDS